MLLFLLALLSFTKGAFCDDFGDYWYQGKAEITSYELLQAQYGEVHPGHAVLIFVTEDFSASKQVKLDHPDKTPNDAVKVLKLNATRKFNTGIYPYSMMSSVFTPVYADQHPKTLKVTTSSQEWCGHTYTQLNQERDGYRAKLLSYFEREGDRDLHWEDGIPEDEIWNRIRLNPDALPTGRVRLIPGTMFQRLKHTAWGVHDATAKHMDHPGDPTLSLYVVEYADIKRKLSITYQTRFPHQVEGWEEAQQSGFGANAAELTTTATRKKRILSDYWRRHDIADAHLREGLGLK
jgi:hypothetical protein